MNRDLQKAQGQPREREERQPALRGQQRVVDLDEREDAQEHPQCAARQQAIVAGILGLSHGAAYCGQMPASW